MSIHKVVTVDIVISNSELFRELGSAVMQTYRELGYDSRLVTTPQQLRHCPDMILFIANFETLELFEPYIRNRPQKPVTVWWYLESLPPAGLSPEALRTSRRLAGCFWPRIITDTLPFMGRWLGQRPSGQKPTRNALTTLLQKILSSRLKCCLQKEGYDCTHLNYLDLFKMTCRLEQICQICKTGYIDYFVTSITSRSLLLRQHHIDAHLVPIGHHPIYGEPLGLPRHIDVAFLGHIRSHHDKRGSIVHRVKKELGRKGYTVEIITGDCFGRKRTELINRTKILVDAVKTPWELPGMRILIGASCGAMIVTTGFSGDGSPYIQGQHFVEAPASKLTDTLLYYLENESERKKFAEQAFTLIHNEITMKNSISHIMELYHAHPIIPSRCL